MKVHLWLLSTALVIVGPALWLTNAQTQNPQSEHKAKSASSEPRSESQPCAGGAPKMSFLEAREAFVKQGLKIRSEGKVLAPRDLIGGIMMLTPFSSWLYVAIVTVLPSVIPSQGERAKARVPKAPFAVWLLQIPANSSVLAFSRRVRMSFFGGGLSPILVLWLGFGVWAGNPQSASKKPNASVTPDAKDSATEVGNPQSAPKKPNASVTPDAKNSATEEQRIRAVHQIRAFADRVAAFRNLGDRTRGLMALADVLWKADKDYARQLLIKAYDSLSTATAVANGPQSSAESREVARLRREVIVRIGKLDPDLSWRLAEAWLEGERGKDVDPSSRSLTYLQTALTLAESKPEDALRFADESVKGGISQTTISFLQKIRQTNEGAARRFFMNLLTTVSRLESVNGNDLLLLGCYVFSHPTVDQLGGVNIANGITWALVGDFTVINIAGREPALPVDQVRGYLKMASAILRRPARTGKERVFNYFAAYQLLPYVKQYLPSQARELELAMQTLKADVPVEWTQPGATSNLTPTRVSEPDEVLQQIENEPIGERREGLALTLCQAACIRGDFNQAEKLTQYISDLGVRAKVKTLVAFYRAAMLVEQGEITTARQTANKMDSGVEAGILWLTIGRRYLEVGDKNGASEALIASLQLARNLDRNESAAILMALAGQFARFDATMGMQILAESVQAFNSIEAQAYKPFRWVRPVSSGGRSVEFSLGFKGLERNFAITIERIVSADPDAATLAVSRLTNEKVLGDALVALSGALLKPRQ